MSGLVVNFGGLKFSMFPVNVTKFTCNSNPNLLKERTIFLAISQLSEESILHLSAIVIVVAVFLRFHTKSASVPTCSSQI